MSTPRLRMFAGPNGSGKSTLKANFDQSLIGVYVNPDEIELALSTTRQLDFRPFRVHATRHEIHEYFTGSLYNQYDVDRRVIEDISIEGNVLTLPGEYTPLYLSSFLSDFIRSKLVQQKE